MELVKSAWIVIFLLFSLTLIFVWSKMYIISRKIKAIDALIAQCDSVNGTTKGDNGKPAQ
jgi:cell division protein FtsL